MVTLLALGAALAYGVADFLGGAVARKSTALKALVLAVPVGLVVVLVAAVLVGGSFSWDSATWGLVGGLAGGTGLITFYRALARGPMSVVAPISALASSVLPVAAGVLRGEHLDSKVLAGVLLCMVAIALVSMENNTPRESSENPDDRGKWVRWLDSGPLMAGISGSCFGVFFILLGTSGDAGGLWPLVAARLGNLFVIVVAVFVFARLRGQNSGPPVSGRLLIGLALLSGFLDAGANALYFIAAQQGLLSLAAVLTSLYPAITVLLARITYSERLRTVQRLGLAVAVAGVALVTIG